MSVYAASLSSSGEATVTALFRNSADTVKAPDFFPMILWQQQKNYCYYCYYY